MTKFLKKDKWGYIFLSPWILFFVIFTAYPFFYGLIISFTDFDFINMRFVGINNYIDIIKDPLFAISTLNILKLAVIIIPFTLTASLWIAKEINNRGRHLQSFVKVSFYLNSIISEVALVIVWKWIFNSSFGASAALAKSLGLEPFDWFATPTKALLVIAFILLIYSVAQPIILYSAAMGSIPETYYEVASIDGASNNQMFFKITLPFLHPTTTFILITQTIAILQIFATPYLMTGGGPDNGTSTLMLLLYKSAFLYGKYGYAGAIGVILFILIAIIAVVQFRLTRSENVQY